MYLRRGASHSPVVGLPVGFPRLYGGVASEWEWKWQQIVGVLSPVVAVCRSLIVVACTGTLGRVLCRRRRRAGVVWPRRRRCSGGCRRAIVVIVRGQMTPWGEGRSA